MELLSYLDTSVVINASLDDRNKAEVALQIIRDPLRRLMVGDYVRLETMPKMRFNKRVKQVRFAEALFNGAIYIPASDAIIKRAHFLAETYGLAGMDAGQSAYADCLGVVPTAQLHTISHGVSAQAETPTQNRR